MAWYYSTVQDRRWAMMIKVYTEFKPSPTTFVNGTPFTGIAAAFDYIASINSEKDDIVHINEMSYTLARMIGEQFFIEWDNSRDIDYEALNYIWDSCKGNMTDYLEAVDAHNKEKNNKI